MNMIQSYVGIEYQARTRPKDIAVEDDCNSYSYKTLFNDARCAINALKSVGIGSEDRVSVVSVNRYEVVVLLIAGMLGGPVVVPVNRRIDIEEMSWIVSDSFSKAVFLDEELLESFDSGEHEVACSFIKSISATQNGSQSDFLSWIRRQEPASDVMNQAASRPYLQVYTSGTSGRPKGVVLTQGNFVAQLMAFTLGLDVPLCPGEEIYVALPLFHVGGIFISLTTLSLGLTVRYLSKFDPSRFDQLVLMGSIDHAVLVPAMMQACVSIGSEVQNPRLRTIMYGASPIREDTLVKTWEKYKTDFVQVYGMTETHSLISMMGADDHRKIFDKKDTNILRSAGKAVPGTVLEIVDENNENVGVGCIGEIRVTSGHVMLGYWNNEEANNAAIKSGTLYTGDVGYLDEDGYLYVVDRLKDIIISGGENISSLEVESVLLSHKSVSDVAVIGLPDDRWGEAVTALVVSSVGAEGLDSISTYAVEHLAGFKAPKRIILVDSIPRNTNGKILKNQLRERYSS